MTALSNRGILGQALAPAWKAPLLLTALAAGWVLFLYRETAWSMVAIWTRSETFAHGFLVLPIALWLVWRQRESLAAKTPVPGRSALLILVPVGLAWLAAQLAAANVLAQLALVAFLAATVPALLGWQVARQLAFPLGFLFFAVPMGEFLIPQLMDWTARFTVLGLRLSGVPVYQEGLEFVIPTGNWSVVEACSGIRYLISSLMVGTLYAYLNFRSLRRRLAFVALSIAVPLVANWVRAYGVVMIGHLSGNRLATGVDHLVYGWLFFGLVVALLFLIGARWAEPAAGAAMAAGEGRGAAPAPADWGGFGLLLLVVSLPALALAAIDGVNTANPAVLEKGKALPVPGWKPVDEAAPAWRPAFGDGADSWHRAFEKDGLQVDLHIGHYRNRDAKPAAPAALFGAAGAPWVPAGTGRLQIDMDGRRLDANRVELRPRPASGPARPLAAWQWYWADGAMTASPHEARARAAWSRLRGEGGDGAAIVLSAPAGGEAALEAFVRSAAPAITHLLNDTRKRR